MKWRATLFLGWQGSLCAPCTVSNFPIYPRCLEPVKCHCDKCGTFYMVLQNKSFISLSLLLCFTYTVIHFHKELWPAFAFCAKSRVLKFYELTLLNWQEVACQKHDIIFNKSCHVSSCHATGDKTGQMVTSVICLLELRYIRCICNHFRYRNAVFSCYNIKNNII